ncbi:DNA gyrase subunit A, chloroplastic/mitochondrial [Cinnamomum micranthum f. kanehirae]|uniref:DNA topoisomerase (ATP-hydrolyzing) n=1 Tax=Cinnamomum micranthum f. kanehirae TaxID=337451 RepID=A0A443N6J1_9MAGN|nr:DNA gyrase subunit A, chloroplastic/mitochondrial [Cinnamomum micranthum f. kanehirae]
MALSTCIRFTASSLLLRRQQRISFPVLSFKPCPVLSDLRFLSGVSRRTPSARAIRAKRRDEERDEGRGDDSGNGSLLVKEEKVGEGRIVPTELHREATEAYMAYAMSVLLGRALPDVRDGLKPVHRRILFAMHELGISSRKPFKKCARVVGEVLGKFHPHGDTAVYDSLVRMAQDFSLRFPLIQGHGNFGSIDADPPAAMRYTECRLEALAEAMLLADLEQNTVDFVPNFDNSQNEPSLLPARVPNLLLNGSSGIAVGMATNIPPHNLGELVDALSVLIHNPHATLQELLEYMPGPDFPTGGLIMGNTGILEAYRTGRGRIVVRGKTDLELLDAKTKRNAVIITEVNTLIPYQTNKSALVEKIADLVENKSLEGISDIRDESDRSGMRIVIEVSKKGAQTHLSFSTICTALHLFNLVLAAICILDGRPKLMGLKELLQAFLDFRCSVIERRAKFKLSHAQDRKHIVEGIIIGLDNLDGVIQLIKANSSLATASAALKKEYDLSSKQAEALLDITLRKLTSLERKKFIDECESLSGEISKLNELLSSKKNILELIEREAVDLKNRFTTPRRSMLDDADGGQLEDIDVIPNEEMLLVYRTFKFFNTDRGIVYSARAYKIPECTRTAAGTPLVQILALSDGERITSFIPVSEFVEDQYLIMLTVNGYIKKVSLNFFSAIRSTGIIAIQLVPGDELKWVRHCSNDDLIAMASQNGMVILSSCKTVRALGRNTRGMIAMRLKKGDKMASMDIIPATMQNDLQRVWEKPDTRVKDTGAPWLLFVSESGHGKRVPLSSFRLSPLRRVGLIGYKLSPDVRLSAVFVVGFSLAEDGESDEQLVLVSQSGTINRIKVRDISIQSRYAR